MIDAINAQIFLRRGTFSLAVHLVVPPGETVALLGPNGSGKSTLLAALAGLVQIEQGSVKIFGQTVASRSEQGKAILVPVERRRIGLLTQNPLLFPHLTVRDNVAFGSRSQGFSRSDARRTADEWLAAFGLERYAKSKPAALSGGQQQQVAIARALAARPQILLLDEPFAALDVHTATQTRSVLSEHLAGQQITTIVVSHDLLDALVLATRCVVLEHGHVSADGPRARIFSEPENQFIATLAGLNLIVGESDGADGVLTHSGALLRGVVPSATRFAVGERVSAVFSPSSVQFQQQNTHAHTQPGQWSATVESLQPSTTGIRIRSTEDPDLVFDVSAGQAVGLDLRPGSRLLLTLNPRDLHIHPRVDPCQTGESDGS